MRITNRQTTTKTLADLYRALDHQHAVSVTYRKETGEESVRTIEIEDIRTTKSGNIIIRAYDRATGEARTFRLTGILTYTCHRSTYQVPRLSEDTEQHLPVPTTAAALIAYEINRDTIAAVHRTRTTLAA
ncbi:hypothetical protein HY68_36810 [Streptomyces sp. AcH 505]|uniref:WYL domain-containing protein n=1 Tax=Streptomyces sp. AcH 505 TaxID=352211 RepID=UPI000591B11C|nr:hypothetical protein HY68_36810 [Streptomyces sp. AcH 505]